jgi:hypothetical protein
VAQLKEPFPARMVVTKLATWEKRLMKARLRSLHESVCQFLTPQVWKQAHQAWPRRAAASRWTLQPLVWTLLAMTWCLGGSEGECFATARAFCVACRSKQRRPGRSLQGFQKALAKVPMKVLRALAHGLRSLLADRFLDVVRIGGFVPLACDGSRLQCPRAAQLQRWFGEAGKTDSPPMMYLSALVLLPLGLPWSWRWGKGTASEHDHLRRLLPTLPDKALIVADAFYQGYDLYTAILQAGASFLVRLSSRSCLYTERRIPLKNFHEGLVYYWPEKMREQGKPPLHVRLLRVRGPKADVWLLTNVLDFLQLGHATAAQLYRWRWQNEGMFRHYKHLLGKVKLCSRTVALAHREVEGAMLALTLLLALAAEGMRGKTMGSPRQMLLHIRGEIMAKLRSLGPRQFATYQRILTVVRSEDRPNRLSSKVRQRWPRRKDHKPPKPPKLRVMDENLKARLMQFLQAG